MDKCNESCQCSSEESGCKCNSDQSCGCSSEESGCNCE